MALTSTLRHPSAPVLVFVWVFLILRNSSSPVTLLSSTSTLLFVRCLPKVLHPFFLVWDGPILLQDFQPGLESDLMHPVWFCRDPSARLGIR